MRRLHGGGKGCDGASQAGGNPERHVVREVSGAFREGLLERISKWWGVRLGSSCAEARR